MRAVIQEKMAAVRGALLKGNMAFVRVAGREYAVEAVSLRQHTVELHIGPGQTLIAEPDEIGPARIVETTDG